MLNSLPSKEATLSNMGPPARATDQPAAGLRVASTRVVGGEESAGPAAHPGLAEARLTLLEDGTFTDVWRWDSAEQMQAALADMARFPEARAAMSLTRDATAVYGEIVDER